MTGGAILRFAGLAGLVSAVVARGVPLTRTYPLEDLCRRRSGPATSKADQLCIFAQIFEPSIHL